jgi:prefoldin alpha subunit
MAENENGQRKLQSLLLQARSYQAALEDMTRQTVLAERALVEISAAIEAIENLPRSKETEAMIQLGAGVFTKARLAAKDEMIVAAGSGVFIQKTGAETKAHLEDRKKRIEANTVKLREDAERINAELEKATMAAEELYAKLGSAAGGQPVY